MKREGRIIFGNKDILNLIKNSEPEDIIVDWYFSYIISLMKILIGSWSVEKYLEMPIINEKIRLALLNFSQVIRNDISVVVHDRAIELSSKKTQVYPQKVMLDLFKYFVKLFSEEPIKINMEIEIFLRMKKGKNISKNFEYAALLLLLKREWPSLKGIFSRVLIQDRFRAAVVLLLTAISKKNFKKNTLKAYSVLEPIIKVKFSKDPIELWFNLRESLFSYWDCAHTVMGL
jgi:hypothetical protein